MLLLLGVGEEKIDITGIPVKKEFALAKEKGKSSGEPFTILLSGSAVSDGKVIQILRWIENLDSPLRILLVAGRNEGLLERLSGYVPPERIRLERFDFVQHMSRLMREADLMITKPGGLVVTEALCAELPMVLISPIPLQETENAFYLEKEGAALYCEHLEDLPFTLRKILGNPEILREMRKKAARLAKPGAATKIAAQVIRRMA
jgi:processive 1,2-diacylglycerol beta-glucosyltransferase